MANFSESLRNLYGLEGIYSLDPDDPGGETVYGVARNKWPGLKLWEIIDHITGSTLQKKLAHFKISKMLIANSDQVKDEVENFYRREFWNSFDCDNLPQMIAEELFEQSVNIGVRQCSLHLQRALNILNRNETAWDDIDEDGRVGRATRKALTEAIKKDSKYLFGILNILQGAFYVNLGNEKYIRGWISRAMWTY